MTSPYTLLSDCLDNSIARYANKVALIEQDKTYTYQELQRAIAIRMSHLSAYISYGKRMIICLENSFEAIVAFWAGLKLGAVISVIQPLHAKRDLGFISHDLKAVLLYTSKTIQENIKQNPQELYPDIFIYYCDKRTVLHRLKPHPPGPTPLDIDLAMIIYTSGSTARPKGVMLTHRNMLSALASIQAYLMYRSQDKILSVLPLSFDYGLYQMLLSMRVGATLILEKDFILPLQTIRQLQSYQVTIFPVVPSMIAVLYAYMQRYTGSFASVRCVTNTGAALSSVHIRQLQALFPRALIYAMYGLTECKRCTYLPPERLGDKAESIGIPIPNTQIWIVDQEGKRVPPGTIGELVVRGAHVMQGYWHRLLETKQRLRNGSLPGERVLYTGDYAYCDQEGYFYFVGRRDDVIKRRGYRISLLSIEAAVLEYSAVKEVAMVAVGEDCQEVHGFMVVNDETNIAELYQYCHQHLMPAMRPDLITILKSLPRTAHGKYDKQLLLKTALSLRVGEQNNTVRLQHVESR